VWARTTPVIVPVRVASTARNCGMKVKLLSVVTESSTCGVVKAAPRS